MTPDDWQKGMENEAASVEDAEWAGEVRRAAYRSRWSRGLIYHLLFQTSLIVLILLVLSPTALGPWLALTALAVSVRAIRTAEIRRAGLGLVFGWAALASAPGAQVLLGTQLPLPAWELRLLALMGVSLLFLLLTSPVK